MKKLIGFIIVILIVYVVGGVVLAEDKIKVDNIKTKIRKTDTKGDVWFSIQATVRDFGDSDEKIILILQCIDKEGFELKSVPLSGLIRANSARVLTDKYFMPLKDYRAIDKWQVK